MDVTRSISFTLRVMSSRSLVYPLQIPLGTKESESLFQSASSDQKRTMHCRQEEFTMAMEPDP
jgi:hypothetical protein